MTLRKITFDLFMKNLQRVRFARNMSARELSIKAQLRQLKRVSDLEDGRGIPTLEELATICQALDVSIDDMLFKQVEIHVKFI